VPWVRLLVAEHQPLRPVNDPRLLHMGLVAYKVTMGTSVLQVLRESPVIFSSGSVHVFFFLLLRTRQNLISRRHLYIKDSSDCLLGYRGRICIADCLPFTTNYLADFSIAWNSVPPSILKKKKKGLNNFPKSKCHLTVLYTRMVTSSKFYTEDPQMLGDIEPYIVSVT